MKRRFTVQEALDHILAENDAEDTPSDTDEPVSEEDDAIEYESEYTDSSDEEGTGWSSNTFSTLIRPMKVWDSAAPSAEDADNSSSSSLEVKENQEEKTLEEQDFLKKHHLPTFCTFSKHKQRTLKRPQLLVDGRDLQFFQNHLTCKRSARAAQKSAVVQLNELRPGLRYETVSKTGPLHAPVFSVSVEVNGFHFEGRGPTKKQAKLRAAELALQSFIQFPNPSQTHGTVERFTRTTVDFTADKLDLPDAGPEASFLGNYNILRCDATRNEVLTSISNHKRTIHVTLDLDSSTNPSRPASTSLLEHLSPVELLNELRPGLRYMCQVEKVHGRPTKNFIMAIRLEGRVFEGCGRSKRRAQVQAAAAALHSVYRISLGPERNLTGLQGSCTNNQLPQLLVVLWTDRTTVSSNRVIFGLLHVSWIIAHLPDLNPAAGEEQSIFVPNKSSAGSFRLRDGVVLHMYVSSSPCGDARLNCPYETTAAHPSRRFCCHLRVKVNGGEGTLPVRAHQKLDGAAPYKPATSMSCTDKIAKWSVAGLQGALLSHLVEPIYLSSLTVGTLSHTGHLGRVMACRLAPVKHLTLPYRRQPLLLGCLSSREAHPAGKTSNVSVNWSCSDGGLEEVSTTTGRRRDSGTPSRLCRRSLFTCWLRLQEQLNGPVLGPEGTTEMYYCSKMAAGHYQRAVQQFSSSLQGGGPGTWIRKPPESSHFSVGV
ncbi:double-stranded RNA-specific editase B2-like [Nematolebias whitei]|uniref:double-stranded RNA-specific editase B2-like n=1 Tax=Nematolebias whitei TaxID=451745 RepID=UPI001898BD6A|nr:double-stranded RNA-specific editase B2-like [Nematolebias whitei]